MLEKIKEIWSLVDEKVFALGLGTFAFTLGKYADKLPSPSFEINAIKIQNVGIFMVIYIGLLYFMCGTKVDIIKAEIIDQHNNAMAILLGCLAIAIAILVTVNS